MTTLGRGYRMTASTLHALQAWYAAQCDGEWEHAFGVVIETLDNPGWRVGIDLTGTPLAGRPFVGISRREPDPDWIHCEVRDRRFEGAGAPHMLEEILQRFLTWASAEGAA